MSLHLSVKHNINEGAAVEKVVKISSYLQKYTNDKEAAASGNITAHEFNRDLTVWFCRDLLPFDAIAKEGMVDFFRKLFPDIQLPTPTTLSNTALNDVYLAVHSQVKDMMKDVKSLCLMFDGWTDKHKARPFMGIRASFVHNWSY